ncbi:pilus assembly protein N-terminal domain-containing protein [Yersinia massiliensis]|uniref:Secretin n=2 Tax=Yersinia TaxID=629 RepID=A0A2R4NL38_9GAMM|nr:MULTISPECIES: pilus assembly protein N-terminal domain-containing protein [Yersinia]HEC1651833.1 pilus assembly protein N-terminal domain-containing protein [Yersinia enterocolitica]ATM87373.1 secretin [Yersinia frederiksenii]AVX36824.1 secretin [Yersinia massiliensis]MCB5317815.1 pilus assembly protein N-terminal domain-containing protein [Yersinia massiliensis]MDA5548888.1 pilus assembly protein N-terminal domain-containing protein [Yersinia massiliensis]
MANNFRRYLNHFRYLPTRILTVLTVIILMTGAAFAQDIYMEKGEARTLKVNAAVDTVFISNPDVADYEVIDEKQVVIFARENGRASLEIYGGENNATLMTMNIVVDPLLGNIKKEMAEEYPGSDIDIKKYGEGYVLTGTVPDEDAREGIYMTIGQALGLKRKETDLKIKPGSVSSIGGDSGGDTSIDFMQKVVFEGLVNRLKLPATNQVNVKLTVVEVTKTFMDNVGVDWSNAGLGAGQFSLTKFRFDANSLNSLIYAIKNDSIARILAEPNLSVLSGETADFLVGGEIPIVTTSMAGSTITYKEFGVKLVIAAKVESNNKIKLNLSEEISSLDGQYALGDLNIPKLRSRKARTTVELGDGDSFVLGGLLNENEKESLSGIPFISDIPILGALFRRTGAERERTELVVVATVNLVKPISFNKVVLPNFVRSNLAERFFNISAIRESKSRKQVTEFLDKGGFAQ